MSSSNLPLDPGRLAHGRSASWGNQSETSPKGTTTFAHEVGYHPSNDGGSISPTSPLGRGNLLDQGMIFQSLGAPIPEPDDLRPQQQVSPFAGPFLPSSASPNPNRNFDAALCVHLVSIPDQLAAPEKQMGRDENPLSDQEIRLGQVILDLPVLEAETCRVVQVSRDI
ncbi:hypothetical protein QFC19_009294 [Naganishia cerealis]|uniref:Uncharacterized protein n=1 Tax=Naganishia cerealis TaxID=610337 RepID=A0ACC2UVF4_9TREE|nr:hypothetical protein QFC19_009294 [Naganishia cerealis]